MTVGEVMDFLQSKGSEQTKKVLIRHGAREPFYGVKVADLKLIQKKVKRDYALSKALYTTGNSDAMYLAGLIAEPDKMTKEELNEWAKQAYWYMLSDYTVAWVASERRYALHLAEIWLKSEAEFVQSAGWNTLASYVAITPDERLDIAYFRNLLKVAEQVLHASPNRVRYSINTFVIAVGCFVTELTEQAKITAQNIGMVSVEMGGTSCKVPKAVEYIQKVEEKGRIGKKRKRAIN